MKINSYSPGRRLRPRGGVIWLCIMKLYLILEKHRLYSQAPDDFYFSHYKNNCPIPDNEQGAHRHHLGLSQTVTSVEFSGNNVTT